MSYNYVILLIGFVLLLACFAISYYIFGQSAAIIISIVGSVLLNYVVLNTMNVKLK